MTGNAGSVSFAQIPRLPAQWWTDPRSAFGVWDENTFYLWGANAANYAICDPEKSLEGGGMAGPEGPSRGRGHPNYIGIITTSLDEKRNDVVFAGLADRLAKGQHIVVPTFHGKFALGSGLAVGWFSQPGDWWISQEYIIGKLCGLIDIAASTRMSRGDFWPDCAGETDCASAVMRSSPGVRPMGSRADLDAILAWLRSKT